MLTSSRARFVLAAAGALSLAFTTPATSQSAPRPAADSGQDSAVADARDPDRVICVRAQLTGSRLYRQVCRTQREWDADGGVPTRR